jgi:hypothetical protein
VKQRKVPKNVQYIVLFVHRSIDRYHITSHIVMRFHALIILVACINAAAAQISSHFSSRDHAYIAEKALSTLSSSSCLRDIYYSIDHLTRIGHTNMPCDCSKLRSLLTANVSAYDGFYGLSSLNICDCGEAPIDLTTTAQRSIQVVC